VAMDLEATCDYCPNPKVTSRTAEIIEFPWIVIDTVTLEIINERQIYVRPDDIEGVTSYATKLTGISKEMLRKKGNLNSAIAQFEEFVKENNFQSDFRIVTDGIWDLQVQLYKETQEKGIKTDWYFRDYFDLKAEFVKFLPWFPQTYRPRLNDMLRALNLPFIGKPHKGLDDSKNIAQIVLKLLLLGHSFSNPQVIPENYDPYTDPNFVDFGSVTEPGSWQCPSETCAVWNRPWSEQCRFCKAIKSKYCRKCNK